MDSIKPVNIRRAKPYNGTLLLVPPQDSGNAVEMMFDFDETEPRARVAVGGEDGAAPQPGEPFFQKKTLTIEDAVEDVLVIRSTATRWAVSFEIRIDYRLGDQAKHVVIDDGGHPFALSPPNCTDRSRRSADGSGDDGHASYERIWELSGDFQAIKEVSGPDRFPLGAPYC
ncbi:hypothetical protein [Micromonospora sp. NBS 11-29]|uniref:hypothetical protein n=1 Tax=Micromonospora sp. NBS 11-29 TaxID=1960879 RepID=UPI000B76D4A4|nr:hypothetical protein [Micromonospora sp. NBS 11-29]